MKQVKSIFSWLLSITIVLGVVLCPLNSNDCLALESTGNYSFDCFITDSRWTEGTPWPQRAPKISPWPSAGCCAYCADLVKYCYNIDNPNAGQNFYNVSGIQAGDVIKVGNGLSDDAWRGHWFFVLKRSGNNLYVAEGAYADTTVRIGWNYSVSGNSIIGANYPMEVGYHFGLPQPINREPIGVIEKCEIVNNNQLHMCGWALDQDESTESIAVHVYVNDAPVISIDAANESNDVNKVYKISGKHRFDKTIDLYVYGKVKINLYAIDTKDPTKNCMLGYDVHETTTYYVNSTNPSLTYATIDAIPDQEYTGEAICPSFTVRYGYRTLREGDHFTVSYTNNINPGYATVTINGTGEYVGSYSTSFKIVQPAQPYTIDLAPYENGEVTPSKTSAKAGETITVDAKPDKGYELESIKVNGTAITGNTFPMPASNVTITVTFKKHELTAKSAKEATCTEDGFKAYYECSNCHKLFSDAEGKKEISAPEIITKLGHKLKLIEEKAPTKTETGVKKHYECERCHKLFSDAEGKNEITAADIVIPVMVHKLTAVVAKAATCTEPGNIEYYACQDSDCGCGKLYSDEYGEHEITLADTVKPATGHTLEKAAAKAATCTAKGNIEYWKCSKCGKLFKDDAGTEELTAADTVTAALGHDKEHLDHHAKVAPGHDEAGSKEYYECPKCHKKFSDPDCTNELTDAEIVIPPVGYAALGEIYESGDYKYQVTNPNIDGTGTVTLIGVVNATSAVSIPSTVEIKLGTYKVNRIGPKAFYGNKTIKTLSIGANVTIIDASAFYGCSNMTKVTGGKALKTIGSSAFAKCSKLKTFSIESPVLSRIGTYAFNKDKKLKTLNIKSTTKLTKSGVKKSLKGSKVKTVKVKKSKVKTYKKYFKKSNSGRKVKVKK